MTEPGRNRLGSEKSPYLLQHRDNPVHWYPWGEEAFAAAKDQFGAGPCIVEDVELAKACFLPEDNATVMQVVVDPDEYSFRVFSRPKGNDGGWNAHVGGKVRVSEHPPSTVQVDLEAIRRRCPYHVGGRCTAREGRPLGCRTYFCDTRTEDALAQTHELLLRRVREIARDTGYPEGYARFPRMLAARGVGRVVRDSGA